MERINNRKTFTLSLLTLVSCVMCAGGVAAEQPNITFPTCAVHYPQSQLTYIDNVLEANGLESFHFDSNANGKWDMEMLIPQDDPNRYPLFYIIDKDYDGKKDYTYIDHKRDGTCSGIEIYWVGGQKDQL